MLEYLTKQVYKERDWKCVLFGLHINSKGVLHATARVVTSSGSFVDNYDSRGTVDLFMNLLRKGVGNAVVVQRQQLSSPMSLLCHNNDRDSICWTLGHAGCLFRRKK